MVVQSYLGLLRLTVSGLQLITCACHVDNHGPTVLFSFSKTREHKYVLLSNLNFGYDFSLKLGIQWRCF